jgi:membrane-bound lytic murein transglycosylase MltF
MIIAVLLGMILPTQVLAKEKIEQNIREEATLQNVDPDLAVAIAKIESSLNPNAVGGLGEIGLFQLRPEYHDVQKGNTKQNIQVGIRYLNQLKQMCIAKFDEAWFVCFNYGPHNKLKYPKETQYFKKVMKEVNRIKVRKYLVKL